MIDITEETGLGQIISFFNEAEPGVTELEKLKNMDYFKTTEKHAFYLAGPAFYELEPDHEDGEIYQFVFRHPSMETCYMGRGNYVKRYKPTSEEVAAIAAHVASGEFGI